MSKQIAVPKPMLPGLADDQHVSRLIASFQMEEVGRHITLDRMPTKDERELFRHRASNLTAKLRRCDMAMADVETARRNLAVMFGGVPSLRNSDADDLLDAYLMVLQSYPLFAIIEAALDAAHGRIPGCDPNFPVNSAVLARRAADYVTPVAAELLKLEKIAKADGVMRAPAADGARERIDASLRDFHGRALGGAVFGTMTEEDRRRARERQALRARQAILDEWKHLGLSPRYTSEGQPMSVALARQSGLLREGGRNER